MLYRVAYYTSRFLFCFVCLPNLVVGVRVPTLARTFLPSGTLRRSFRGVCKVAASTSLALVFLRHPAFVEGVSCTIRGRLARVVLDPPLLVRIAGVFSEVFLVNLFGHPLLVRCL